MKTIIKNPLSIIGWPMCVVALFFIQCMLYMAFKTIVLPSLVWWFNYVPIFF